jgi:hypothetical protein
MSESTLVSRFVTQKVCGYPLAFLPLTPALLLANVFDIYAFLTVWSVLLILFLILWLIVPCNPNLNCTADTKKRDGTKALVVSFLFIYSAFLAVAITGKLFLCDSSSRQHEGSVLENVRSLFEKDNFSS